MDNKLPSSSADTFNSSAEDFFKLQIQRCEQNQKCFDCDAPFPQWTSVTHGAYICMNCSNVHKALGSSVSLVRSIIMDSWTDHQLALMRNGGNKKLAEFLDHYDLNSEDIKVKYNTKAAQRYRERLEALAQGQPIPTEALPEYEEGRQLFEGKKSQTPKVALAKQSSNNEIIDFMYPTAEEMKNNNEPQYQQQYESEETKALLNDGFVNDEDAQQQQHEKTTDEKLEEWTNNVLLKASTMYDKVSTEAKEMLVKTKESEAYNNAGEKAKVVYERASTITKETGVKVKDKLDEIGVTQAATETLGKIQFGGKMLGGFLLSKAKQAQTAVNGKIDANPKLSNARDSTKEKLGVFSSAVSTKWSSFYSKYAPKQDQQESGHTDVQQENFSHLEQRNIDQEGDHHFQPMPQFDEERLGDDDKILTPDQNKENDIQPNKAFRL